MLRCAREMAVSVMAGGDAAWLGRANLDIEDPRAATYRKAAQTSEES